MVSMTARRARAHETNATFEVQAKVFDWNQMLPSGLDAEQPVVVIVDEAASPGSSTTLLLRAIARRIPGARVFVFANREAPAPASEPAGHAPHPPEIALDREGDVWCLRAGDTALRLKDGKGVRYLQWLLAHPGQELHVSQLVAETEPPPATSPTAAKQLLGQVALRVSRGGDAGPILDRQARDAYRRRLEDLRDELDEATRWDDEGRAERARVEMEAIAEQLSAAVGLGGRDRHASSATERSRINVQRRLRDALRKIEGHHPALGRYLSAAIRTGSYCSYNPRPSYHPARQILSSP
jgi:non-specific serine/threonine protein kinase